MGSASRRPARPQRPRHASRVAAPGLTIRFTVHCFFLRSLLIINHSRYGIGKLIMLRFTALRLCSVPVLTLVRQSALNEAGAELHASRSCALECRPQSCHPRTEGVVIRARIRLTAPHKAGRPKLLTPPIKEFGRLVAITARGPRDRTVCGGESVDPATSGLAATAKARARKQGEATTQRSPGRDQLTHD